MFDTTRLGNSHPLKLDLRVEHWPLKRPFVISGHQFETSSTVIATVGDGIVSGRGEASGVYYRGDTPERIIAAIEAVRARIEAGATRHDLQQFLPPGGARNALDCALWDLEAARTRTPVWKLAGLHATRPLLTTWTIGVASPVAMAAIAKGYTEARAIKLKLTGDAEDTDRVRAVRAARADVWLSVDANQACTPNSLRKLQPVLRECGIALIEQPFPIGSDAWLDAADRSIPFAADESLQSLDDLRAIAQRYEVINIKLDKCGGLTEGLSMARRARAMGLKVMVGNMTGTSLGMAPALVLGQLCDIVDLDGPIFLAKDYVPGVRYADGTVQIPEAYWGGVEAMQPLPHD